MKKVLLIIVAAFFTILLGGGFYYYFIAGKSNKGSQSATPTEKNTTQTTTIEESGTDSSACPENLICLGSKQIASIPTITLGKNDVYAQEAGTEQNTGTQQGALQQQQDIKDNTPQVITITNKDIKIWSLIWVTNSPQKGYVKYGTSKGDLQKKAFDVRDGGESNMTDRYTHHVTITNTEDELAQDNVKFYFKIVSGIEEFGVSGDPYEYSNVTLTASPSTPQSVSITSTKVAGFSVNDFIVIARQIDTSGAKSSSVSGVFTDKGGVDLVIGIARTENLTSYFPYSKTNKLEVKIYGPDGNTGYAQDAPVASFDTQDLTVKMNKTGYTGDLFASSSGSTFSFNQRATLTTTVATTTKKSQTMPKTGIEDKGIYTSLFGLVMFMLGLFIVVLYIPWNYKKLWEQRIIKRYSKH
jgi:hypothetical protein